MSDNGFVYILINASMDGLIKVGKTTRDPEERAKELSKATGVPTPFIVAYQSAVNSCSKAEEFVHTYLQTHGYRVNENREFFDAPMTIAIDAIAEYKNTLDEKFKDNNDIIKTNKINSEPIWQIYEENGDAFHYGLNDTLQNDDKALENYLQAYKLGSVSVCRKIGNILSVNDIRSDGRKALEYYNYGIERGDMLCYGDMMLLYFGENNIDNALKCWDKYVEFYQNDTDKISSFIIAQYFKYLYIFNLRLVHIEKIRDKRLDIYYAASNISDESIKYNVLKYIDYVFSADSDTSIIACQDYINEKVAKETARKNEVLQNRGKTIALVMFIICLFVSGYFSIHIATTFLGFIALTIIMACVFFVILFFIALQ